MNAVIIAIGDELLIGQVVDSNSTFIGQVLSELGIKVIRKWTTGDKAEEIKYTLRQASESADLILLTGGLGPTKDDITKKTLAEYFETPLVFNQQNYDHLLKLLSYRNLPVKESYLEQCYIPSIAELLDNRLGTALGMWIEHKNKIFISLPGVPDEMKYIMTYQVIPRLSDRFIVDKYFSRTYYTCGIGETDIADRLEPLLNEFADKISIAYLPSIAQVKFRISIQSETDLSILEECSKKIYQEFGNVIFGEGNTNISQELGKLLLSRKLTMGTVESCTGGEIASKISSIPGSSAYYKGSLITYATELKEKILNIPNESIQKYNVVSSQIAEEMVKKAANILNTDLVISSTGIAGPEGGTEDIPIGTIYISCGNQSRILTQKLKLSKNRERNIEAASVLALNLAREWVLSIEQ